MQAADKFDKGRGVKFIDYARVVITNKLIDYCRRENSQKVMIAQRWTITQEDEEEAPEPPFYDDGFSSVDHREFFVQFISTLSQTDCILVSARYAGKTQAECTKILSMKTGRRYTLSAVCKRLKELLALYHQFAVTY